MNVKISSARTCCNRRVAFTFVELLVVAGTIAILSVILLPVLASTKPNVITFQCLENQRRLAQAFVLYPGDNNGAIVLSGNMDGYIQPSSVNWNVTGQSAAVSLQNFQACVNSAANPLYPYGSNVKTIHCPGDIRYRNTPGNGWAYDSYSKPNNVGGESYANYWGQGGTYTKLSQVAVPAQTFAFREDVDSRGRNLGTWVLNWSLNAPQFGHTQSFTWVDPPIPMYHGNVTTAAFVDGHAEFHKWTDRTLIQYGLSIAGGVTLFSPPNPPNQGPDYEYVYQNFRFPGWQP